MRPWWSYVIFFLVFGGVLGGLHFYLWRRFVKDLHLERRPRRFLSVLVWGAFLALLLSFPLYRFVPLDFQGVVMYFTFGWLGVMFILVVLGFLREAGLGVHKVATRSQPSSERRLFLKRASAAAVGAFASGLTIYSVKEALSALHVRDLDVKLAGLPESMRGYRIVQVTDIHVGPTIQRGFTEEMVRQINELKPDLVAVTGDLVDGSVENLGRHVAPLGDIVAKDGVYFVPGNHEYYSGLDEWLAFLETLGVPTLMNAWLPIRSAEGDGFDLIGLDDETGEPDGAKATRGREPDRPAIVLAHQPRTIKHIERYVGNGLQLSGHTHAGQIWPFNFLVHLVQPYVSGLHRRGAYQIYVSPGTGYWGPPMRLGTQAEITSIRLV